ncbi:tautomerase family protein [Bacillus sp. JJ664]
MPIIQVQMLEGRSTDVKNNLLKEMNEVVCRILDVSPEQVRILLNEYTEENWSIGGISKANQSKK